jgi:tRNA A-37 threonylcarbamoyl transferase component Bud32
LTKVRSEPETENQQVTAQPCSEFPPRYQNRGLLGEGGYGRVYRAHDQQLGRDVAIKVLLFEGARDPRLQERFAREARLLASLDHPAIVKILAWGTNENGNPYQVLEFVEGTTLAVQIGRDRRLSPTRFREIFAACLAGLDYAHGCGVIHRDIKPTNIIICTRADEFAIKIVDFGIARQLDDSAGSGRTLTQTGHLLGSPVYMSPEQCRGDRIDRLTDIYSLGCVMYETLSGQPPHQADSSLELMYKHMTVQAPKLEELARDSVSRRLGRLVDACLSRDPQNRPQTAAEILLELNRIFESNLAGSAFFSLSAPTGKGRVWQYGGATLLVLAAVAAFFVVPFLQHLKTAPQTAEMDPSERKIQDLESRLRSQEWLFKNPKTNSQKVQRADELVSLLLAKAELERKLKRYSDAEKTIERAFTYCRDTDEPANCTGRVIHQMGVCKLKENDFEAAQKEFEKGLLILHPNLKIMKFHAHHTNVSTMLAEGLALAHIKAHKLKEVSRDLRILDAVEYKQNKKERKLDAGQGPPLVREITQVLALQKLNSRQDQIDAMALHIQASEYLLAQESPLSTESKEAMLTLLEQIPGDTPNYAQLAAGACRVLALSAEQNHDKQDALKYRRLADAYTKPAAQK